MNRKNLQNISLNDLDKSEIKEKNENFLTAENINIKSRYTKNDLKNIEQIDSMDYKTVCRFFNC